jgi:two-component system sensor histidine kinase UhpB
MRQKLALPWRGLIPQLFFLVILPVTILLLVFTLGNISVHQQAMRSLVGERDERAVRGAAGALSIEIENRLATLQTLARLSDSGDPKALQQSLDRLGNLAGFDLGVAFFTPEGNLIAAGGAENGDPGLWEEVASGGFAAFDTFLPAPGSETLISPVLKVPGSDQKAVLVTYRSSSPAGDPSTQVVTVGAFSPEALARKVLSQAFPAEEVSLAMIDRDGETLYWEGAVDMGASLAASTSVKEALQGHSGTANRMSEEGEQVVAYSPIPAAGWALLAEESWDMVANPTLEMTQVAPLVLVPLLLIFLAALWFGARQVIQPLQSLEAKAASVAWGNYQEIEKPVGGIAEIRRLQAELIHLTQKVQVAQQSLHSYIGAITAGQEEERQRLARELHDDTLQSLIALKQRVQLARLTLQEQPEGEVLVELEGLAEQTIDNLRRLTRALRPIYLEELGLGAALEMLAREANQTGGASIYFQRHGPERRLPPSEELALYRIAQEAISNVLRHSNATQAYLSIQYAEGSVTLSVSDNGKGFEVPNSPAEFAPGGHFGLLGLHERAELIGAKLEIRSSPGKGAQLTVELPSARKTNAISDDEQSRPESTRSLI